MRLLATATNMPRSITRKVLAARQRLTRKRAVVLKQQKRNPVVNLVVQAPRAVLPRARPAAPRSLVLPRSPVVPKAAVLQSPSPVVAPKLALPRVRLAAQRSLVVLKPVVPRRLVPPRNLVALKSLAVPRSPAALKVLVQKDILIRMGNVT